MGPRGFQGPIGLTRLTKADNDRFKPLEAAQSTLVRKSTLDVGLQRTIHLGNLGRCLGALEDAIDDLSRQLRFGYGSSLETRTETPILPKPSFS